MTGLTLGEIREWTDARVVGILVPDRGVTGVSTDTRTVAPGEVFVALRGSSFDGHGFLPQAAERGAVAAVVEDGVEAGRGCPLPLLTVPSPLEALGALARHYRQRFDLPVVAVVGSSGKTTTKEMIAAVLGRRYRVLKNRGNENNEIGVPKTLLQLEHDHEAVVLELAARHPGDIRYLCSIACPTVGVLLNIGTAHLECFGSVEGVAKAKGELLEYLDESLTALVNVDDRVVAKEAKRTKGRLFGFGLRRESQYRGEGLVLDQEGCGHFSLQNHPFHLRIPGRHNVYNALAAAAVGHLLGVPWGDVQQSLGGFDAVPLRSAVVRHRGAELIDDSYNANPDSVRAGLELLRDRRAGRRIAVLGDMLELGPRAEELHAEVGRAAVEAGVDLLLATGGLSAATVAAARAAGLSPERALHFADSEALLACLRETLVPGDVVLVKASRAVGLDQLVTRLVG